MESFCFFCFSWFWYIDPWSELHPNHRIFLWIFYFFLSGPLLPYIIGWDRMSYQMYRHLFHRRKKTSSLSSSSWQRQTLIHFSFGMPLFHHCTATFSDITLQRSVVDAIHLKETGICCIWEGWVSGRIWVCYTHYIDFSYFRLGMLHEVLIKLENPDQVG